MAFTGYDKKYLDEYRRRAQTELGRRIIQARWNLVRKFCSCGSLLDYGCGTGAFHTEAPKGFAARGWDINPNSVYYEHVPSGRYNILTMWDVIEHLPSPLRPVVKHRPDWVFVSTPNAYSIPATGFRDWKHFKPLEHLHYYTPMTLEMAMAGLGYTLEHLGYEEGELRDPENRTAIFTGVYKCHTS